MQEIGNITAFVSFNLLLVILAIWLLFGILLYEIINEKEDKLNIKNKMKRYGLIIYRQKLAIALCPAFALLVSACNIMIIAKDIAKYFIPSIIVITLNIVFCIGIIVSIVMYYKLKNKEHKDISEIKRYNFVLAFTTIAVFADTVFAFIWSR